MIELCKSIGKNNDNFVMWDCDKNNDSEIPEKYKSCLVKKDDDFGKKLMIGIIAADIIYSPTDIKSRLNIIYKLCGEINRDDWIQNLKENEEHIHYKGGWLCYWDGPYCKDKWQKCYISDELWDTYKDSLRDSY